MKERSALLAWIAVVSIVTVISTGCGADADRAPGEPSARPGASATTGRTMMVAPAEGELARRNKFRVPEVIGMRPREARRVLGDAGYACSIAYEEGRGPGPGRVSAQRPRPGARGFEAQSVGLTVSGAFRGEAVTPGCGDDRDEPWTTNLTG